MTDKIIKFAVVNSKEFQLQIYWNFVAKILDFLLQKNSYIYANGVIAGFVDIDGEKSETRRYCVTNHQGSVEKIVDGKDFVLWASCYTAFGIKEGETVNKIEFTGMFTGKDMAPETGLT